MILSICEMLKIPQINPFSLATKRFIRKRPTFNKYFSKCFFWFKFISKCNTASPLVNFVLLWRHSRFTEKCQKWRKFQVFKTFCSLCKISCNAGKISMWVNWKLHRMARRKSADKRNSVSPPKSSQNPEKEFENENSVRRQSRRFAVFVCNLRVYLWLEK